MFKLAKLFLRLALAETVAELVLRSRGDTIGICVNLSSGLYSESESRDAKRWMICELDDRGVVGSEERLLLLKLVVEPVKEGTGLSAPSGWLPLLLSLIRLSISLPLHVILVANSIRTVFRDSRTPSSAFYWTAIGA